MNRLLFASLSLVFLLASAVAPAFAQAPFSGMKYRIPSDANTLILINAEKIFGSPVADREHWDARRKAAFESGVSALPPDAIEVVLAGRSDHEFGKTLWELSLVKLRGQRNVSTVATRFGGEMDVIAERSAARLPDDHYVVQISDTMLGSYTPANRQDVSRWLKSTDTTDGSKMSPYLEQALGYATKVGTPIVMAMDVSGYISATTIKTRLSTLETLKDADADLNELAKLISTVQGITLGITLQDQTVGAIRVDFEQSPELLAKVGKPMLMEVLKRQGAMIDDFENWTPSISGNTFLMKGTLSTDGTRRVMSVLELPRTLADSMFAASSPGSDPEGSAKRIASQQYYNSVTTLIDDLREKPKRDHVKTFGQAAMWYDKYARKIDQLPLLNVDEALLNWGAQIADSFRNAEMFMKGVGMRSSVRTENNNASSGGYYSTGGGYRAGYGYGGAGYGSAGYSVSLGAGRASVNEKGRTDSNIRSQERTRGAASVQEIWRQIDDSVAGIRREMTEKYNVEF
ncbi:hypothetical protein NHH03_13840 [Stieleria sp. TO1_6]|uniref:hypothetical protein n=1 Tax=Stieleria tagensis TaxID=2956795 RepID=UPI00209B90E7|nr:hypothetical protein [Stieleria tagensis]MCO8122825.1 hypothetical protein [Stieleria tagensis]